MERKTIEELMDEVKQYANNWGLKKIVDNLKKNTYYYFVYFNYNRPCCIIRKFKNAIWKKGAPCCSIYDVDNRKIITFIPNVPYDIVQDKDYIYVKFSSVYAGVFYITRSIQTAHNVLRKECKNKKDNPFIVINPKFYKNCMEQLKKFITNPSLKETINKLV